jgi:hypothetical protein
MNRLSPLVFIAIACTAQPLLAQNAFNPLMLLNQAQGNPFSGGYSNISSPLGLGALNPMNPINTINPLSPWNSYGMNNPALTLGGLSALGALGALAPNLPQGLQFAPGMGQGNFGNPMNNPLMGNPYNGNPFSRAPQQQQYFNPGFSPSAPSFPNVPFVPFSNQQQQNPMQGGAMQGGYYPAQQQGFPFTPYGAQQQQQMPPNYFNMQQQPTYPPAYPNYYGAQQPAPQQQPPTLPNFFGMTQPQQAPTQQFASPFTQFPMQQNQQIQQMQPPATPPKTTAPTWQQPSAMPFPFFAIQPPQPLPQTQPQTAASTAAAPATPEAQTENAEQPAPPLDPAAFMQMYSTPAEPSK